ncbi:hypothetical protein CPB86DRAFT_791861 [Serendipita vermifera]|nr:hypothetical protein CPB86DRAFT_791861 [Serendipita vermifera]
MAPSPLPTQLDHLTETLKELSSSVLLSTSISPVPSQIDYPAPAHKKLSSEVLSFVIMGAVMAYGAVCVILMAIWEWRCGNLPWESPPQADIDLQIMRLQSFQYELYP